MPFKKPDFLSPGDKIAIVAPSSAMSCDKLEKACRTLREWGYEPVPGPVAGRKSEFPKDGVEDYSASASERAAELLWALESDEFKLVLCTRGGYGALHLAGLIPSSVIREHPKWLVGYSDITTLHAVFLEAGVMSIHGPMCAAIGEHGGRDESCAALRGLLSGGMPSYELAPHPFNVTGTAEGVLMGGNMITMAALKGTAYDFLNHRDIILFVEEVGENFHAVDRLMNMLISSPDFCNVRGLVFGGFTDCRRDLPSGSVEEILAGYVQSLGIPACFGFPAGHGDVNMPFVEGAEVRLEVGISDVRLEINGPPITVSGSISAGTV